MVQKVKGFSDGMHLLGQLTMMFKYTKQYFYVKKINK